MFFDARALTRPLWHVAPQHEWAISMRTRSHADSIANRPNYNNSNNKTGRNSSSNHKKENRRPSLPLDNMHVSHSHNHDDNKSRRSKNAAAWGTGKKKKRTELRAHKRCAILLNDYLLVCAECSYCSYNLVSHFLCVFDGRRRRRFRLRLQPSHRNLLKFIARFLLDSMRLRFG